MTNNIKKTTKKKTTKRAPSKKIVKPNEDVTFKTAIAVHKYLSEKGYVVGDSKVSKDIKDGLIPKQKGGHMLLSHVLQYAKKEKLSKPDGSAAAIVTADNKQKQDARLTRIRADDLEFTLEVKKGKFVLKSDLVQDLASRAAVLKDMVGPNFIRALVEEIIRTCNGDIKKAPDVIAIHEKRIGEAFNIYSKPIQLEAPSISLIEEDN